MGSAYLSGDAYFKFWPTGGALIQRERLFGNLNPCGIVSIKDY